MSYDAFSQALVGNLNVELALQGRRETQRLDRIEADAESQQRRAGVCMRQQVGFEVQLGDQQPFDCGDNLDFLHVTDLEAQPGACGEAEVVAEERIRSHAPARDAGPSAISA